MFLIPLQRWWDMAPSPGSTSPRSPTCLTLKMWLMLVFLFQVRFLLLGRGVHTTPGTSAFPFYSAALCSFHLDCVRCLILWMRRRALAYLVIFLLLDVLLRPPSPWFFPPSACFLQCPIDSRDRGGAWTSFVFLPLPSITSVVVFQGYLKKNIVKACKHVLCGHLIIMIYVLPL